MVMWLKRIEGLASKEEAIEGKHIITKSKIKKSKVNCIFIFLGN